MKLGVQAANLEVVIGQAVIRRETRPTQPLPELAVAVSANGMHVDPRQGIQHRLSEL